MSSSEYLQKQLKQLNWEEKYLKSMIDLHEDQLSRLKVEELALKHKISVEEGGVQSTDKAKKNTEKVMETDESINTIPLKLGINQTYDCNEDDEEEEEEDEDDEEEEDDDDDEINDKTYDPLKVFIDKLSKREQNQA
ncbi:snRNA-activating protein complex subunit 5-like [Argonauta hians]